MKKKVLSILLALVMVVGTVPFGAITAFAAEAVNYMYPLTYIKGKVYFTTAQCTDYKVIDSNNKPTDWEKNTWYVVRGEVTISDRVKCDGAVHLILTDGCKLTCSKGIQVETATFSDDASLTIYAQSEGDNKGQLIATGDEKRAGIGSGHTVNQINGDITGDIVICGGYVNATGGECAAGIGGGAVANGGNVTVFGGEVIAEGGAGGAGIGGGQENLVNTGGEGGNFTIYGGYVKATSIQDAAGIGGGKAGDGGSVNLFGGRVDVTGGYIDELLYANAFGRGYGGDGDGSVTVGDGLAVFDAITGKGQFNGGFDQKPWGEIFFGHDTFNISIRPCGNPVTYQAYDPATDRDEVKTCSSYTYVNSNTKNWTDGWYVVNNSGTFTEPVTVTGDVALIIENGKTLNALAGIQVRQPATLTIYGQPEGNEPAGKLIATANAASRAGIGSTGDGYNGGAVTIHGCDVVATGGKNAAGIGGGQNGAGSTIYLYGGTLTATAGAGAPRAIGAGYYTGLWHGNGEFVIRKNRVLRDLETNELIGNDPYIDNWSDLLEGTTLSIGLTQQDPIAYKYYNDSMVLTDGETRAYKFLTADDRKLSDGGWYIVNENITLPSGEHLTVNGDANIILCDGCQLNIPSPGGNWAGIELTKGNSLSVYAQEAGTGSITAMCGEYATGIGGNYCEDGGTLNIHGGTVTAYGDTGAAAIGGGNGGDGGEFNMYGGTVVAQNVGDSDGAGIGSGAHAVRYVPNYDTGGYDRLENTTAGKINIYGGTVNATGRAAGPGIGGGNGCNAGEIRIYGGDITATSGSGLVAGIDNGVSLTDDNQIVRAEGGSVTVSPRKEGEFIRVKWNDSEIAGSPFVEEAEIIDKLTVKDITDVFAGQVVKITTGHFHTFEGDYVDNGDGTHSRKCIYCGALGEPVNHTFEDGECSACGYKCEHDFSGDGVDNGNGTHSRKCIACGKLDEPAEHTFENCVCTACGAEMLEVKYIDRSWDNTKKQVVSVESDEPVDALVITKDTVELFGGWYVVSKNTENKNRIVVKGTVNDPTNIILMDGVKLDVKYGIEVANEFVLNIYTQNNDTGEIAAGSNIGGGKKTRGGTITVNGGTVTAVGGTFAAGIGGGGDKGHGGRFTMNGGTVTATSHMGAGIGGGDGGVGGIITINGGTVTAKSDNAGAGIGCGDRMSGGTITINGGTVTATSKNGAGIGGGNQAAGSIFIMNGGTVTATSTNGAAIGGGEGSTGHGTLTVADGLTVKAGENADNAEPVTAEDYRTNRNHYVKIYNKHGEQFVKCAVNVAGGTPENCTVTLTDTENAENVYNGVIDGENTYYVDNIANGTYLLTVASDGTVTRTYTVEIDGGAVEKSAELYAEGDVNGDGVIDENDYQQAVNIALSSENSVSETDDLSEDTDYSKTVADFDKDGFVDVIDLVLFERKIF